MGTLYLVATPIGNLEDITQRAINTLRDVGCIAAEDTRHTRKLLEHYQIETTMISYHEHSKGTRIEYILSELDTVDVAYGLSPGTFVGAVSAYCQEALIRGVRGGDATPNAICGREAPADG